MTTNNHPAPGPLSNDRLTRISDILRKAAAQSNGGNIGYAMSDAVKALDELLEVRKAEPVAFINGAWTLVYYRPPKESGLKIGDKLYTAPPAPVANDDLHEAVSDLLAALDKYPEQIVPINRKSFLVRTIRAAMLNGGKS